jgi:hypothetical protein
MNTAFWCINPTEKRIVSYRWENNIKMELKGIGLETVDRIYMAHDWASEWR